MTSVTLLTTLPLLVSSTSEASEIVPKTAEPFGPTPLTTLQDEEEEYDGWSGSVLFGYTQQQGNTERESLSLDADAERTIDDTHRFETRMWLTKATESGDVTDRQSGIIGQYDYLAGEKHYYYTNARYEKDKTANLEYRYAFGSGVGYQFYDNEEVKFSTEVGLGYYKEVYRTVGDADDVTARLAYELEYVFNENTRFIQDFEAYPVINDFDDVFLRMDSRLETNLTARWVGAVQHIMDWDNTPAPGSKRDDHRIVFSLGWSFGA